VLGQIDGASNLAQVNGTFANIAENVGLALTPQQTSYQRGGTTYTAAEYDALLATEQAAAAAAAAAVASSARTFTLQDRDGGGLAGAGYYIGDPTAANADLAPTGTWYNTLAEAVTAAGLGSEVRLLATVVNSVTFTYTYQINGTGPVFANPTDAIASVTDPLEDSLVSAFEATFTTTTTDGASGGVLNIIDGSITNIIIGVTAATEAASAGVTTATELTLPTFDFGDMATTALGTVNTGEITLGVNAALDETRTLTTNAVAAAMTQIGGSADTGALVLNLSSNTYAVNGAIQNTLLAVNGSIGNTSTTALGAVNTGAITSGVTAAVQGIVAMAGQ
jgi:hypothetical protein